MFHSESSSEMTVSEFDTQHLNSNLKRLAIQSIIVAVMHFKWGFMVPIIISPRTPGPRPPCARACAHVAVVQ